MALTDRFGDGKELVDQLGAMIRSDGLSDLLAGFNDAGEESKVESWLGSIPNEPTEPSAVKRAVGEGRIAAMAAQLGASPDEVADGLARVIPAAVDALTPGGHRPTGKQLDGLDLGQVLSGIDVGGLLR
jgi:uncharacterized protein YidB (DUF937 family)